VKLTIYLLLVPDLKKECREFTPTPLYSVSVWWIVLTDFVFTLCGVISATFRYVGIHY